MTIFLDIIYPSKSPTRYGEIRVYGFMYTASSALLARALKELV